MGVKAPARRLEMQGALNAHRETLETLMDRLEDLRQVSDAKALQDGARC